MENENIIVTPSPEIKKYMLTRRTERTEELGIYFMLILQNAPVGTMNMIPGMMTQRCVGIIAFNYEEAKERAVKTYNPDGNAVINSSDKDFAPMKDILKVINYEGVVIQNILPAEEKQKPMGMENFKLSLQLACDEYVKSDVHKMALKKIIEAL